LIVRRLGDETIVYDRATHRAYCLNRAASLVFHRCDGRTSSEELARRLRDKLTDLPDAEAPGFVGLALRQLSEAGLLEKPMVEAPRAPPSRRAALRVLATTAALPVVLSILAPTPAEAQTCVRRFRVCTSSQQCCPQAPCCRPIIPAAPRARCLRRTGPGCIP